MTPGDVTESRTRAQRHGRVRLALALAVVAIVTGGAVVLARRSIAERLVHLALASAGHGDARLEVVDVGPRGIELHDLRIGVAPALELDALDVRWTPWRGRIDALHARGLRMRADLRGAAPVASPAAAPDLSPLALALPRAIRIEDARIDLDTDVGPLSLALALAASLEPAGAEVEGAAQLEIQSGASRADLSLAVRGTPGKLGGTLALRADVDGLPQLPLALRANGTARVGWDGHALELYTPECLDVHVERIGRVLRLASPLVACAGEPGARLLRVELAGGSPRYRADVPLRARELRLAWSGGTLAARAPRLALTVDSTETVRYALEAEGESIEVSAPPLRLDTWSATARLNGAALESTLRARALHDLRTPAWLAPLELRASLRRTRAAGPLDLRFELSSAQGRRVVAGEGSVDPGALRVHSELRLERLAIGRDTLRLAALSPWLGRALPDAQGEVEASGSADWSPDAGLRFDVDLAVRNAAFVTRAARFVGVNGAVRLQGPDPLVTPPGQIVSAALTDVGLPLTDGLLQFELRPGGVLGIESATWHALGGTLSTRGTFDLASARNAIPLDVRGLDLAELARMANLAGLTASGKLDGSLPLRLSDGDVQIDRAELRSTGPGSIRYLPAQGPDALGSRRPELALALRALEDLRYDELRVALQGDARASVLTQVHLRGSNPALDAGRPIEFNLSLDAPLASLLRASLAAYRLPEAVERRLRDFPGGELR